MSGRGRELQSPGKRLCVVTEHRGNRVNLNDIMEGTEGIISARDRGTLEGFKGLTLSEHRN